MYVCTDIIESCHSLLHGIVDMQYYTNNKYWINNVIFVLQAAITRGNLSRKNTGYCWRSESNILHSDCIFITSLITVKSTFPTYLHALTISMLNFDCKSFLRLHLFMALFGVHCSWWLSWWCDPLAPAASPAGLWVWRSRTKVCRSRRRATVSASRSWRRGYRSWAGSTRRCRSSRPDSRSGGGRRTRRPRTVMAARPSSPSALERCEWGGNIAITLA